MFRAKTANPSLRSPPKKTSKGVFLVVPVYPAKRGRCTREQTHETRSSSAKQLEPASPKSPAERREARPRAFRVGAVGSKPGKRVPFWVCHVFLAPFLAGFEGTLTGSRPFFGRCTNQEADLGLKMPMMLAGIGLNPFFSFEVWFCSPQKPK